MPLLKSWSWRQLEQKQIGGCYVTAKRPKYRAVKRKEFIENWELYINFPKIFTIPSIEYDPHGEEGKYCFLCWENGIKVSTRDPDLVKKAIEGKESINLQIKIWSEGLWDRQLQMPLFFPHEIHEYCRGYPSWVYQAVINQTKKRVLEDLGFVPTWLKVGDFP